MIITEYLERNARLYGNETSLVEVNPSEERDQAATWWDFNLIESASQDAPYRRELSWRDFDRRANRFANLLLSRGLKKGTKVAVLLMNCLEWLPIYFGILKAGCVAVPMNFRYSSDEIKYCLDLADVEVLVFGPEFVSRMDAIQNQIPAVRMLFYVGKDGPAYTEDCLRLMGFCSSSAPPVALRTRTTRLFTFPPARPASPRLFCIITRPCSAPAPPSRSTTPRVGRMYFCAFRPCTTPVRKCTGLVPCSPAPRRCCCGA